MRERPHARRHEPERERVVRDEHADLELGERRELVGRPARDVRGRALGQPAAVEQRVVRSGTPTRYAELMMDASSVAWMSVFAATAPAPRPGKRASSWRSHTAFAAPDMVDATDAIASTCATSSGRGSSGGATRWSAGNTSSSRVASGMSAAASDVVGGAAAAVPRSMSCVATSAPDASTPAWRKAIGR